MRGASPQHRGHPRSWVGGSSSCGSAGTGPLRSSGRTRTRGSSVTSLQALNGEEKGRTRGLAQAGTPTCPPSPGRGPTLEMEGPGVGRGTDAKEGQSRRALTAHRTWASSQVAEAAFLVGCKHIGAPVSARPWGVVGPQAALLARPTAAGTRFPRGPGGPGTVPSHAAGARAQGQLCGWDRTTLSCSQSPDPRFPAPAQVPTSSARAGYDPFCPPFRSDPDCCVALATRPQFPLSQGNSGGEGGDSSPRLPGWLRDLDGTFLQGGVFGTHMSEDGWKVAALPNSCWGSQRRPRVRLRTPYWHKEY